MLNNLFQGIFDSQSAGIISVPHFLLCVAVSLVIGLLLAGAHTYKNRYTRSFLVTLAMLPAIVCVVIMMVNGNVGAGVAVAGAFSLVRFRSVPGTAREIGAIFSTMCTGLNQAVANQTIAGLAQGRRITGKVLFLGGPLYYCKGLRKRFQETLKLSNEDAVIRKLMIMFSGSLSDTLLGSCDIFL